MRCATLRRTDHDSHSEHRRPPLVARSGRSAQGTSHAQLAGMRLRNQRLVAPHCAAAEDVVAWLGAVQAQDYAGAKWAIAQRMRRGSDAAVEAALQSGALHIVAYKDRHASFDPRIAASRSQALASPSIVMNGQLIGGWRRTLERDAVCIEAKPLVPLTRAERAQLREAGDDYGRFLGMSVRWTGE